MSKFVWPIVVYLATILPSGIQGSALVQEGSQTVEAAARQAFDKGAQELASGNHTGAITLLKTATRIRPENAAYQHKLAKAYLAAKKYQDMWVHLRKATVLDLGNEAYAGDFLKMWQYHDLEGMLNVGTPADTILKNLGEPDKRIENEQMKRWVYGFMAVDFGKGGVFRVIDLRGYSPEAAQEIEMLKVKTDPAKWTVAHHQVSRTNDNLELTLKHEKIQNWTELFSKQRFPMSAANASIARMVDSIRQNLKNVDPNAVFEIISRSNDEIFYHWRTAETANNSAQHEIAKIMRGKKDCYRVAYVKKTRQLSEKEFNQWSKVISDATLVPVNETMKSAAISRTGDSKMQVAAWELGKSLSFAALIRGKHGSAQAVQNSLLKVSRNAQALDVSVPPPAKLTDDVTADTAAALHYLLETAGKPIYQSLEKQHGSVHAALFELATKSNMLTMMYQPDDSTSQALSSAIVRSAQKAKLNESVWITLTEKVDSAATQNEVSTAIKEFQMRVAAAIDAR